ncbi:hypothetical protein MKW98_004354, partial [Papaver atlanticum]
MRTIQAIIWQPWRDDQFSEFQEVQVAKNLSKTRIVFYGWKGERLSVYLGERFCHQITGEIVIPCDPPDLDSVHPFDVEAVHHYLLPPDPELYNAWWKEKSFEKFYPEGVTNIQNHDVIGVVDSTRRSRPSRPPPDLMSQSYDDYPEDESVSELPVVDWRFPVYINGELSDLVVPRPTSYPYNFDHITARR